MKSNLYFTALMILMLISCKDDSNKDKIPLTSKQESISSDDERFRPFFHFTPEANWMNDPNGMFYLDGVWHLFFQYYPEGNQWGPMHWGHAVSTDLVNWQEEPIALSPDENGYIFSGSAVVDHDNTSGFGDGATPPVIAIFTYHNPEKENTGSTDVESQAIAYSTDQGRTWIKYDENPVLENPGILNFRDPKVIWDTMHKQWVMALAADDRTYFYGSQNLKEWEFLSEFGSDVGAHDGVWECPDLFPMTVEGTDTTKWVLLQNLNPGGPNGGSATQYFIGDFNGREFMLDKAFRDELNGREAVWLDQGMDNYATVTWDNAPEGRRVSLGWMSNWLYAQEVPTKKWRSSMTIARDLSLVATDEGYRLKTLPVKELDEFITDRIQKQDLELNGLTTLLTKNEMDLSSSVIDMELSGLTDASYVFLLSNEVGDTLRFGLVNTDTSIFIDRSKSGIIDFSGDFTSDITRAPLAAPIEKLSFKLVLDKTSMELFYNDGEEALTQIFFPHSPFTKFELQIPDSNRVRSSFEAALIQTDKKKNP
ncbi:glycoside hydrolase family 32 protein [Robertkochia solimangrovi]|uniref:glycoside hydrolase family 32 protein n=1 Tax=Robertkochia solimangrovi TaxID=2213046 RepID=UPI00117E902F|nr:glycoside hydrolase family 32 protein [Robertkochia solimangrovi]TRZ41889.1 glycoside hydrolase family 32 protein [Robertkochia solimangrovi]